MTGATSSELLRRKIARQPAARRVSAPTAAGALFAAFARQCELRLDLAVALETAQTADGVGADFADGLPENPLVLLLRDAEGRIAACALDHGAVSALVAKLTLGSLGRPQPPRRPTRTDAAMVSHFADAMLADFDALAEGASFGLGRTGFRYGSHLADPRPLGLILDAPAYHVAGLRLRLDPGGLDLRARIDLAFPEARAVPVPDSADPGADDTAGDSPAAAAAAAAADEGDWQEQLVRTALAAHADLQAVLARLTLSLGDVLALAPGQSLTLPPGALGQVRLEGAGGVPVSLARLGQAQGARVLRLSLEAGDEALAAAGTAHAARLVMAADDPMRMAPTPPVAPPADAPVAADGAAMNGAASPDNPALTRAG